MFSRFTLAGLEKINAGFPSGLPAGNVKMLPWHRGSTRVVSSTGCDQVTPPSLLMADLRLLPMRPRMLISSEPSDSSTTWHSLVSPELGTKPPIFHVLP